MLKLHTNIVKFLSDAVHYNKYKCPVVYLTQHQVVLFTNNFSEL